MDVIWIIKIVSYAALGIMLLLAAFWDIRERRIPNWLSLTVVMIFFTKTGALLLAGSTLYTAMIGPLFVGLAVFIVSLILFQFNAFGGGDAKLLSALALFTPFPLLLPMLLVMAIAGGLVASVILLMRRIKSLEGRIQNTVPYGVAIMTAGFWMTAQTLAAAG